MMLIDVFVEVMLPLLLLAGLGGWVGRRAGMPVLALSTLIFHLLSPALVFHTLATLDISAGLASRLVAVVGIEFLCSAVIVYGLSQVLRWPRSAAAGAALSVALTNGGTMGLPIAAIAFGSEGLAVAVVAMVTGAVLSSTGGIVIASLAGSAVRGALAAPFKVPAIWAVPPALLVNRELVPFPEWLATTSETLAGAAIPSMLVVLGLQIMARSPTPADARELFLPLTVRLLGGPAIALAATIALGVEGVARDTLIVLGGMPTAVGATIIAIRYDAHPELVSRTAVLTTGFSFITLTALITLIA